MLEEVQRRLFLAGVAFVPGLFAEVSKPAGGVLRGILERGPGSKPAIRSGGKLVFVSGDDPTLGVMRDERLTGKEVEVVGHQAREEFEIDPIHTRSLFLVKDGKKLIVTYWCDVCHIRTYTPGKCWCCQEETQLDPLPPEPLNP